MSPTVIPSLAEHMDAAPYIIGVLIAALGWLLRRYIGKVWTDLTDKIAALGTADEARHAALDKRLTALADDMASRAATSSREHSDFRRMLYDHEGRIAAVEVAVFDRRPGGRRGNDPPREQHAVGDEP